MGEKISQAQQVFQWLQTHPKGLTQLEAVLEMRPRITNLSARISELRRDLGLQPEGFEIESVEESNAETRWVRYKLVKNEPQGELNLDNATGEGLGVHPEVDPLEGLSPDCSGDLFRDGVEIA